MSISVSQTYPSRFLSPTDVTRPIAVTINAVTVEEFRQRNGTQEPRIVLAFRGARKVMILNKTQANTLAALFGDNAEEWINRTVQLQPARAQNGKDTVAVMRPPTPAAPESAPAPETCEICGEPTTTHAPGCPDNPDAEAA